MTQRQTVKLYLASLLALVSLCITTNLLASTEERTFYYSKDFAHRLNLPSTGAATQWKGTIGILISKNSNGAAPRCHMTLYLGDDIPFSYPQSSNYTNLLGEQVEQLFFFQPRLPEKDEIYLTQHSLLGSNRITIKSIDKAGRTRAMENLVISTVDKNILPGISLINSYPFFCSVMEDEKNRVDVLFQQSSKQGDVSRTKTIREYTIRFGEK